MSNIPIVFIHEGDSSYLYNTLRQARKSGNTEVLLIGDDSNKHYPFVTQHFQIKDFNKSATDFAQYYKHLSVNGFLYTLFCTQRWFILNEFMRKQKIEKCFYQDSDNMLYMNVSHMQKRFNEYPFAMFVTAHMGFVNNQSLLDKYCQFVLEIYQKPQLLNELMKQHRNGVNIHDGNLFGLFFQKSQVPFKNFNYLEVFDGFTFDDNINCGTGYEMYQGKKKIFLINQKFYCRRIDSNRLIEFKTLQFQGHAKKFIKYFSDEMISDASNPAIFDYDACKWLPLTVLNHNPVTPSNKQPQNRSEKRLPIIKQKALRRNSRFSPRPNRVAMNRRIRNNSLGNRGRVRPTPRRIRRSKNSLE